MNLATERRPFIANAVFIPDDQDVNVDPEVCIKLMIDGDNNGADVYTEEAWTHDGEPLCRRERGGFTQIDGGRVELLPELWIVKIDERDYWLDEEVLATCPRMCGVYLFDRRQHFHLCSVEPCYELHFLGTQYEESPDFIDDEYRRDEIIRKVLEGDSQCDQVTYWGKADIDRMLHTEIGEGLLPPDGKHGGYRLDGIVSVTASDAIEEAREAHSVSEL